MKKHKFTCFFITVLAGFILACGAALAAWNISEYAVNLLTMASFRNSIQENYIRPDHVDPGQKVAKEVNVRNDGNVASYVRVKIGRVFGTVDGAGQFKENSELDPEMIQIHYNTDFWTLCEDGYWYYKDVLDAGQTTRKPLMDSYYLSEKADNRYKSKEARILVNMECIQAESGEMKAIWGKEEKELGITSQPCTCETVTSVTFGKNHKLVIGGEKTDLFANFKNLQPGCKRSQTIRLTNNSDTSIKLYLRAELAKQKKYSQKKLEMLQKLLTEYAEIQIRENDKVLYQGSVDGNLQGKGWSMKKDISLGSFAPGAGRSLIVQLSLSGEMDNTYEELLGKVKWVFTATGDDSGLHEGNDSPGDDDSSGGGAHGGDLDNGSDGNRGSSDGNGGSGGNGGSSGNGGESGSSGNNGNNGAGYGNPAEEKIYATAAASPKTGDPTQVAAKWFALFAALTAMILTGRKLYRKEKSR